MISNEPAINPPETLNNDGVSSTSLSPDPFSGFARLITIMMEMISTKVIVIRSMNANCGKVPPDHEGRNLSIVETGMVSNAPVNAAAEVVRFQKKPMRKIARTPGEINPTYSWMNWYA